MTKKEMIITGIFFIGLIVSIVTILGVESGRGNNSDYSIGTSKNESNSNEGKEEGELTLSDDELQKYIIEKYFNEYKNNSEDIPEGAIKDE